MKTSTLLLAAAAGVAILIVYKRVATKPKTPLDQVTDGLGSIIKGAGSWIGGKGLAATAPARSQEQKASTSPSPGAEIDLEHSAYSLRVPTTGFVLAEIPSP